jgi:hypothetical protein
MTAIMEGDRERQNACYRDGATPANDVAATSIKMDRSRSLVLID